jgi:hypothetical protein
LLVLRWQLDFTPTTERSCGVAKIRRKNPRNTRVTLSKNPPKTVIYEALATLNRDFDQVLGDLQALEPMQVFPLRWQRRVLKTLRTAVEETRAWANFEVIEVLHEREEREWARFGRIRRRSEKPSELPAAVSVPATASVRKSQYRN